MIETKEKVPLDERENEMSVRAQRRSPNYSNMTARQQWEEDKRLGLLDWDGR